MKSSLIFLLFFILNGSASAAYPIHQCSSKAVPTNKPVAIKVLYFQSENRISVIAQMNASSQWYSITNDNIYYGINTGSDVLDTESTIHVGNIISTPTNKPDQFVNIIIPEPVPSFNSYASYKTVITITDKSSNFEYVPTMIYPATCVTSFKW
jgi:hypothetical protein